jgi:hypothetical protein
MVGSATIPGTSLGSAKEIRYALGLLGFLVALLNRPKEGFGDSVTHEGGTAHRVSVLDLSRRLCGGDYFYFFYGNPSFGI